jgi:hypothetical protein
VDLRAFSPVDIGVNEVLECVVDSRWERAYLILAPRGQRDGRGLAVRVKKEGDYRGILVVRHF